MRARLLQPALPSGAPLVVAWVWLQPQPRPDQPSRCALVRRGFFARAGRPGLPFTCKCTAEITISHVTSISRAFQRYQEHVILTTLTRGPSKRRLHPSPPEQRSFVSFGSARECADYGACCSLSWEVGGDMYIFVMSIPRPFQRYQEHVILTTSTGGPPGAGAHTTPPGRLS